MNLGRIELLLSILAIFLVIFILLAAIFEAVLLGVAYFNADKVECTLLWCTFTTEKRTVETTQDCFENGKRINCSNINWPENW